MALESVGAATPLTESGMTQATQRLQVGLPEIWAELKVEVTGESRTAGRCVAPWGLERESPKSKRDAAFDLATWLPFRGWILGRSP